MDRLDRMLALVRADFPDVQLIDKRTVPWMRALGALLRPVVPRFETHFTTVIGRRIYLPKAPEELVPASLAATLAHEYVHMLDQREHGLVFYATYVGIPPTGRTQRARWELRAYTVDLLLARERHGADWAREVAAWMVPLFAGPSYGWMYSGEDAARELIAPVLEQVLAGELDDVEPYDRILAAWRG